MISKKEFKSPLKFPGSGYELVTCHYPLRLDTYSGCAHDCVYCYAGFLLRARGMWDPESIKMANIKTIEDAFQNAFKSLRQSPISNAIRHKLPVRIGGLTDCFQKCEIETGTSLKLLKLLNKHDYPFMIVTKSDVVARKEYLAEIAKGKAYVQVTLITLDEKVLRKIEPGAPKASARIKAIKKLSDKGVFVCARFSPVIPSLSTDHVEEYVDTMARAGVRHILAEFFRGTKAMIHQIEELTGTSFMDVMEKKGAYYRVNINYKNKFYAKLKHLCTKKKIGFTICSDGDLVPQNFNTTINCCGTDSITGFENCSTCTANMVAREAASKGKVTLQEMKGNYWSPDFSCFEKMWQSGRIQELVNSVEKQGEIYVTRQHK